MDDFRIERNAFLAHTTSVYEAMNATEADFGELRDGVGAGVPGVHYLLRSLDFGLTWSWFKLPPHLQTANVLAADPTDAKTLYALGSGCLSHSTDRGETWSPCSTAPGIGCDGPCPPDQSLPPVSLAPMIAHLMSN